MSRNNDPVENAIEQVGGAIAGALIAGLIGYAFGRHQRNSQKDFRLPDRLRSDQSGSKVGVIVELSDEEKRVSQWLTFVLLGALAFGYFSASALCGAIAPGQSDIIFLVAAPSFCVCVITALYLMSIRNSYASQRAVQRPELPGLDLASVQVYSVRLSKDSPWQVQTAGRFMQQALFKTGRLMFQIAATHDHISWRIIDWQGGIEPSVMRQAVLAFYPDAEIVQGNYAEPDFEETFYRLSRGVYQEQPFIKPIAYVEDLGHFDPLVNLVQEMNGLGEGERIVYTLAVTEPAQFVYQQAREVLTIKVPVNPFDVGSMAYAAGAQLDNRVSPYDEKDLRVYMAKLQNLVYQTVVFFQVDATSEARAWDLMALISQMAQYDRQFYNQLSPQQAALRSASGWIKSAEKAQDTSAIGLLDRWLRNQTTEWRGCRLLLDTQEIAALWHLPHEAFQASSIAWTKGRQLPLPNIMRKEKEGVMLGYNRHAGNEQAVYLPQEDRATHMSVIGQTGSGKSTLLHNLIHADILAGRGVAVIDPKGHLVQDILQASIPTEREDDVVVLDVADIENPPPLNLLAVPGAMEHGNAVELLLAVFEKLYPDFAGKRMADTFSMAVQTLWNAGTPTLLDVERLFEDLDYRRQMVALSDNFVVRHFWAQFESKTQGQQDEFAYPIISKMRQFYGNQILLPMMCHPEPLDLFSLIRQNKIILVSLKISEAKLPPREQQLLGEVLISQIQMAAMSDAITNPPFYLFIDEAQNFVTTSLPQMLTTARSSGLALIMANQHLKQLSGDTLDAVLGNVGAAISFQVGEHDAKIVAKLRAGFTADDLMQLDKYKAGVFMRYKGETQPAFSLDTLPPPEPTHESIGKAREKVLRAKSRSKYSARSRQEIMGWLAQRYATPSEKAASNGRVEDSFYDQT